MGLIGGSRVEADELLLELLIISVYFCLCLLNISVTVTSVFKVGCRRKKILRNTLEMGQTFSGKRRPEQSLEEEGRESIGERRWQEKMGGWDSKLKEQMEKDEINCRERKKRSNIFSYLCFRKCLQFTKVRFA